VSQPPITRTHTHTHTRARAHLSHSLHIAVSAKFTLCTRCYANPNNEARKSPDHEVRTYILLTCTIHTHKRFVRVDLRFTDGRHRFCVFRDLGLSCIPVLVPEEQLEGFDRRYVECARGRVAVWVGRRRGGGGGGGGGGGRGGGGGAPALLHPPPPPTTTTTTTITITLHRHHHHSSHRPRPPRHRTTRVALQIWSVRTRTLSHAKPDRLCRRRIGIARHVQ
jgi:hypothetical protein